MQILSGQNESKNDSTLAVTLDPFLVFANHTPAHFSKKTRIVAILSSEKMKTAPVANLENVLQGFSSIDLRLRGSYGVQSDVRIRGGHYEQTMLLLNGVNFNDPQTGHFNMNLPVCFESVSLIEVLYGSYARNLGANAMSGAVNIVIRPEDRNFVRLSLMTGQHFLFSSGIQANFARKNSRHYLAVNRISSQGYKENTDFKNINTYYTGNLLSKKGILEFQTGYSNRNFGANSFYTARFPDQFESVETAIASIRFQSNTKVKLIPLIYWRYNTDRFELFRNFKNAPAWYTGHNYHKTNVLGASLSLMYESVLGSTTLAFTFRNEAIYSTLLGLQTNATKPVRGTSLEYNRYYSRNYSGILFDHKYSYKNLTIAAGIMANMNSDIKGFKFLPGADASYMIAKNFKIVGSVNTSLRMPTFTDLFYSAPTLSGNPSLTYEQALTTELGLQFINKNIHLHAGVFERHGENLIDWILFPGDSIWRSENITEITYRGIEFSGILEPETVPRKFRFFRNFRVSYTYIDFNKTSDQFLSAYTLDQLRHKGNASVSIQLIKNLGLTYSFSYYSRYGSFMKYENGTEIGITPYGDFMMSDIRLFLISGHWNLFADMNNMFNTKYFDIGNIEQAGRWIRIGGNYAFSLK